MQTWKNNLMGLFESKNISVFGRKCLFRRLNSHAATTKVERSFICGHAATKLNFEIDNPCFTHYLTLNQIKMCSLFCFDHESNIILMIQLWLSYFILKCKERQREAYHYTTWKRYDQDIANWCLRQDFNPWPLSPQPIALQTELPSWVFLKSLQVFPEFQNLKK